MNESASQKVYPDLLIRGAAETDLPAIMTFDERSNKDANPRYWQEMFARYGNDKFKQLFLVCESGSEIVENKIQKNPREDFIKLWLSDAHQFMVNGPTVLFSSWQQLAQLSVWVISGNFLI